MPEIYFRTNDHAILFSQIDDKINRMFMIQKNPEHAKKHEESGLINKPWDKVLTKFIKDKDNRSFFGNGKVVNGRGNIFRDFTSHAPLADSDSFYKTLENLMILGYDVSEEELDSMRKLFPKFKSLMETKEFKQIVDMTKNYRNRIERRWRESSENIDEHFADILGYDITDASKKVITYVMPPISENQRNYKISRDKVYFFWSQPETTKKNNRDYSITAIAHEKLLHLLPYTSTMSGDKKKILHAFIKFVANKELYHRITGNSYLENDSKDEDGRAMGLIYPYWLGYLHRKDEFPEQEIAEDIRRDKEVFDRLKPNSRKRKLYEDYHFEKLSPEKIAKFFRYRKGILPYEFVDIDFNYTNVYHDEYIYDETR